MIFFVVERSSILLMPLSPFAKHSFTISEDFEKEKTLDYVYFQILLRIRRQETLPPAFCISQRGGLCSGTKPQQKL